MTKAQALDIMMTLSALESWSFSTGKAIPDYLREDMMASVEILRATVLEDSCQDQ